MERIAQFIAMLAYNAAMSAAGCASDWNLYQPKEPTLLKKLAK